MSASTANKIVLNESKAIEFPGTQRQLQITLTPNELQKMIQDAIAGAQKKEKTKRRRTNSMYTRSGRKKPTPADPVRNKEDFQKIVRYFETTGDPKYRVRNKTLFVLGCSVGLRCGDLINLKTEDVYTPNGRVKKHIELIEQKTGKRNVCKIPSLAADVLTEYMDENDFTVNKDTYLFISKKNGNPLTVNGVYRMLKIAGKNCGLDYELSTHTMRKTYAMAALQSAEQDGNIGNTLEMLQMKLNHSDARITMRYCKAAQDKMDEMSDRVSDWFE